MLSEVTIFQAWQLWFEGPIPPTTVVLGLALFKWVRIGKMLQFLGVFMVVVEIIGVERIRNIGVSLKNILPVKNLHMLNFSAWQFCSDIYKHMVLPSMSQRRIDANERLKKSNLFIYTSLITLLSCIVCLFYLLDKFSFVQSVKGTGIIAFVIPVAIGTSIYLVASLLLCVAKTAESLALFLSNRFIDRWIKLLILPFMVVGFLFDLLGS